MKKKIFVRFILVLLTVCVISAARAATSVGMPEYKPVPLPFNNDASAGLYGMYEGSYGPASATVPVGRSKWITSIGADNSIQPNTPDAGVATIVDGSIQHGSLLIIKRLLDNQRDFCR